MGTKLGGKPGGKPGGKKPFKAQQKKTERGNKSGAAADGSNKQHKAAFFKADKGSRKRKFEGGGKKNPPGFLLVSLFLTVGLDKSLVNSKK